MKKKGLCRTFKSTGECRFGDDCRFGHAASDDASAAAAYLLVAVAIQDPEEDQMGIDLEEFTCGADLGPGCTKAYKTCPSFGVELGKKKHKTFVTPTSCKYCRNIKRENWNSHRRTNTTAKPIREVADLTMAAVEPTYEPFVYDLDSDDDDAMADYASGFFSNLMIAVDLEEVISEDDTPISHMRGSRIPIERHECRENSAGCCAKYEVESGCW